LLAFQQGRLSEARALAEGFADAGGPQHQADHLLGLIHCRQGELEPGVSCLRRALSAQPDNPGYRLMLARALIDAGAAAEAQKIAQDLPSTHGSAAFALLQVEAEAAAACGDLTGEVSALRQIAGARPSDWRAWNDLGSALARAADWPAAVTALERAWSLAPGEPLVCTNLAGALRGAGQLHESARVLLELLERRPEHVDVRIALCSVLAEAGEHEQAIPHLQLAREHAPNRAELALAHARGLVAAASFAAGEAVFREIVSKDPADATAAYELGLLLERTGKLSELTSLLDSLEAEVLADPRFRFLEAVLLHRNGDSAAALAKMETGSPHADPLRWHRLRSKIAEALGRSGEAFSAAVAMNQATPDYANWRPAGAKYRQRLRELAAGIDENWYAALPQLRPSIRRAPAFLVGFPRSGTTLLDTFLMGHPRVHVLEEVHLLGAAELVIGKLIDLPTCSEKLLEEARDAYLAELDRHVPASFDGLVVDKLPLNMLGAPLINALFPNARIIFSQRHPCDAVLSGVMQSFVLNDAMACFLDLEDAADLYDVAMSLWTGHRSCLPLRVHDIVYEELVRDPQGTLHPLLQFLELEWADEVLRHQVTAAARGTIATASYDQVTRPLDQRPSGRWRRYRDEMTLVLPGLLSWARRLGYAD